MELGVDRHDLPGGDKIRLGELEYAGRILIGENPASGYRVTIVPVGKHGVPMTVTIGASRRAVGRMLTTEMDFEKNGGSFSA